MSLTQTEAAPFSRDRRDEAAHGPGPAHENALAEEVPGAGRGVQGDGERLDAGGQRQGDGVVDDHALPRLHQRVFGHDALHVRGAGRRAVVAQGGAEVLPPGTAPLAGPALVGGVDDDFLAGEQAVRARAHGVHNAADFMAEDHGLAHHGVTHAANMVIVEIAAADAHAAHAQADMPRRGFRQRALFDAQVLGAVEHTCFHDECP